jgi:multiple sugar transport system ATP-binding protein
MGGIRLEKLTKSFGGPAVVRGLDVTLAPGSLLVLAGPPGSGKTMTLRLIAGLEAATSGAVWIEDEDVSRKGARERNLAFIPDPPSLYPHMNVRQNISFPLHCARLPSDEINSRVDGMAESLGIGALLSSSVKGLSAADRLRVALARALVREPMLLLLDEPLASLPPSERSGMADMLRALHGRHRVTTIIAMRDPFTAMALADQLAMLDQGALEQLGPAQDVHQRPASLSVASYFGPAGMNFLFFHGSARRGALAMRMGDVQITVPRIEEDVEARELVLGIRPEHVQLQDSSRLRGPVMAIEYVGGAQLITVETAQGEIRARIGAGERVRLDQQVGLRLLPGKLSLFDKTTGRAILTAWKERDHV